MCLFRWDFWLHKMLWKKCGKKWFLFPKKRSHIWKGEIDCCCRSATSWDVKSLKFSLRRQTLESICLSPVIFSSTFFQDTLDLSKKTLKWLFSARKAPHHPPGCSTFNFWSRKRCEFLGRNGPKKAVPQNDSWGRKEWPKDPKVWKKKQGFKEKVFMVAVSEICCSLAKCSTPKKKARAKFLTQFHMLFRWFGLMIEFLKHAKGLMCCSNCKIGWLTFESWTKVFVQKFGFEWKSLPKAWSKLDG